MHRSTLLKAFGATAVAALILTSQPAVQSQAAVSPSKSAASKPTPFLVGSAGYSSRVVGGVLPTNSDRTAFAIIGCTNRAGLERTNGKANLELPGGIDLAALKTRAWTTKHGTTVSSYSRQSIGKVTLLDTPLGSLYLDAVVAKTRAWHDSRGFHSTASSDLGGIVLDPVIGDPQRIAIPLPGQSVTIPGLATITLGKGTRTENRHGATATVDAVKLRVIPTNTTVFLAHSTATIKDKVPTALYRGSAFGLKADVAEGVLTSDRTPNIITPCLGTSGKVRSQDIAELDPDASGVHASGLRATTQSGKDARGRNFVTNTARVAGVNLGSGLHVNVINARAHIHKAGNKFVKSSAGTTLGSITLNGNRITLPANGVLEIPGVARLETNIVDKTRTSITVTALRVTLLDGRLAVVNVGYARSALVPTGL